MLLKLSWMDKDEMLWTLLLEFCETGGFAVGYWSTCLEKVRGKGSHTSSSSSLVFQVCAQIHEEGNLASSRYGLHRKLVVLLLSIMEYNFHLPVNARLVTNSAWLKDSEMCRYKPGEVWLEKDVILPYVPNVEVCDAKCLLDSQSQRSILLFFRGRLKRNAVRIFLRITCIIHSKTFYLLDYLVIL